MSKITKIVTAAAVLGVVGVSALPIASFAVPTPQSQNVNVSVEVTDGLSLTCNGNYSHSYGAASDATDSTGTASEATPGTCTVVTNDASGYTLTVAGTSNTNLVNGGNTIGTNPSHTGGTPGWSIDYSTTAGGNISGTRKAVAASGSPAQVASPTTVSTSGGDVYKYGFATSIAATTVAGTYAGQVTFTATGK